MLKVVLEVAPDAFAYWPLALIIVAAALALVGAVFFTRYRRKGDR